MEKMNFLKFYYHITNSKFPNEKVEGFPRGVTKGSRLFTIILLYTLIIISLVVSLLFIIKKQSGYWVLIAPVLFYILLLSSCNFSMIQFLVLYIFVHTRNQYIKLLYSYYFNYSFSQDLIIKSNRLVKKCGAKQTYINFVIELKELNGRKTFPENIEITSLLVK